VTVGPCGNLVNPNVRVTRGVTQTPGQDYKTFLEYGVVSRENPPCD